MEDILREFIDRGWFEPCNVESACPSFVVPKRLARR